MKYWPIKYDKKFKSKAVRERTASNLLKLKKQIKSDLPGKDSDETLMLATWNIRELGNKKPKAKRLYENLFYMAEIISSFDIVAVQEVNDLDDLEELMRILGDEWDFIATDVNDRSLGGNGERMCFVYDTRKVKFKNIAGEIVLPANLLISKTELKEDGKKIIAGKQFRRAPFLVSFQAGWFKFDLCTVHIYFGANSGKKLEERVEEIDGVASYLGKIAKKEQKDKATILLGDFNIMNPEHKTMAALESNNFIVPKALQKKTNLKLDKYYDQIAFYGSDDLFRLGSKGQEKAGVFYIDKVLYTDWSVYEKEMRQNNEAKGKHDPWLRDEYFKKWKTFQMSDHHLMWAQLKINDSNGYLEKIIGTKKT